MRLRHEPAVDFQLLFAGAARADSGRSAAGNALEMAPHLRQARIGVLHLRQLDLKLRFGSVGARGEDIEDQFGTIEDLDPLAARRADGFIDQFLQLADLAGGEIVVEENDVGSFFLGKLGNFHNLAAAEISGGIDFLPFL